MIRMHYSYGCIDGPCPEDLLRVQQITAEDFEVVLR